MAATEPRPGDPTARRSRAVAPATSHQERVGRSRVARPMLAFVVLMRLCMGVTCVLYLIAFLPLEAYPASGRAVLHAYRPALSATLFALLAAALMLPVVRIACRRLRRRRRAIVPERHPAVAWLDSRFGIRGRYFEHLLVSAEVAEMAAQTVNLVILAPSGIAAASVRSFAGILAASCVVSPLLMLSSNIIVYIDLVVLADILFDFVLSVVWPLSAVIPWSLRSVLCSGELTDWHFVIAGLAQIHAMMPETAVELVAKLVPFVQAHILLLELERITREENRDLFLHHAVVPVAAVAQLRAELRQRRSPRWVRRLLVVLGVSYAASVVAVTLEATQDRCDAQPMCQRQGYPLFSSECSCVLVDPGCSGSVFEEAEFDRTVRANADSLQVVDLDGCGLAELPAAMRDTELPELAVLAANDNALETMDGVERHPSLIFAHLRSNRLTQVPKFHDDGDIGLLMLGDNPLRALRTDTHDLRHLIRFEAINAQLGAIPCEWGALPLVDVVISNSSVSSLPAGCFGEWEESLLILGLNDNNISAPLPFDMSGLVELTLGGNPLCAGSTAGSCEPTCAPSCMPWELDNVVCNDFRCGVEECGFDAADCAEKETCGAG